MVNSSALQENTTHPLTTRSKLSQFLQWTFILLIIIGFICFLCFMTLILNVFFKTPALRENARYVLFVFLLLNDTLYLFVGFYLLFASMFLLRVSVPLCYLLYMFSSVTYLISPCNLAAMALEQYIAICHPLRYAEFCTAQRANAAFTVICFLGMIPYVAEFYVMVLSMANIFSLHILCYQENLVFNPIQNVLRSVTLILCFILVAVVIVFTYIKIVLVAKKVSFLSASASKAGKTVMIHAVQLLLCTGSLLSIVTQEFVTTWPDILPIAHYFVFTCLPRYLSPLIYGIRDEFLRQYIKKSLSRLHGLGTNQTLI